MNGCRETSEANCLSVRSVSKMGLEQIDSIKVLGIFCTLAMCRSAVVKLLYVIGCHTGIRFLASKKLWASVGVWIRMTSGSNCWVGCELVHRQCGLGVAIVFLVLPGLPNIFWGGGGVLLFDCMGWEYSKGSIV